MGPRLERTMVGTGLGMIGNGLNTRGILGIIGNGLCIGGNRILLGRSNILVGVLPGMILIIRVLNGGLGNGRGTGGNPGRLKRRRATFGRLLNRRALILLIIYGKGDIGGRIMRCICLILAILAMCAAAIIALFLAIICFARSHIAILILEAIAIVRKGFLGTGLGRAGIRFLFLMVHFPLVSADQPGQQDVIL